jgi:hypothetical protein
MSHAALPQVGFEPRVTDAAARASVCFALLTGQVYFGCPLLLQAKRYLADVTSEIATISFVMSSAPNRATFTRPPFTTWMP